MGDSRPIGVFDSGIGGLTIARAIQELMPNEEIIFFGDTAHLPYGDKSSIAIRGYVHRITEFFIEKGCKAVVIACNSASAAAYNHIHKSFGQVLPILNVIDPIVEFITRDGMYKNIGVIATKATISTNVFPKKIHAIDENLVVRSMATPLLAPMIEEGYFNNNISQTIINSYLSNKKLANIEALVLACTHYPLIRNEIDKYYRMNQHKVDVVDCMQVMALKTKAELQKNMLLAPEDNVPEHHFYVSDFTQSFQKTTQIFFGYELKLEPYPIWKES